MLCQGRPRDQTVEQQQFEIKQNQIGKIYCRVILQYGREIPQTSSIQTVNQEVIRDRSSLTFLSSIK